MGEHFVGQREGVRVDGRAAVQWLLTLVAAAALVAFTGGMRSPFMPLLVLPSVVGLGAGIARVPLLVLPQAAALFAVWWWWTSPGDGPPWKPIEDAVLLVGAVGISWALALRLRAQLDAAEARAHAAATALVEAEALRLRELELVASGVAHELKNPLTAVRGLVSHLAAAEGATLGMQRLADAVRSLAARVDEFLAVTRPSPTAKPTPADAPVELRIFQFLAIARWVVLGLGVVISLLLFSAGYQGWRVAVSLALCAALAAWQLAGPRTVTDATRAAAPIMLFAASHYLLTGAAEGPLRAAMVTPVALVALVARRPGAATAAGVGAAALAAAGLAVHLMLPRELAVPAMLDLSRPEVLRGLGVAVHFVLTLWPMVATALAFREGRRWLAAALGRRLDGLESAARLERGRWLAFEAFFDGIVKALSPQLASVLEATRAERDVATGKTRERMDVVLHELERMQRLLADVGCLAAAPAPEAVSAHEVDALVGRLLPAWQAGAAARQVEVSAATTNGLRVRAEQLRFEMIVTNMVKNAVEASPSGSRVVISAHAADATVSVTVDDTGHGLPVSLAQTLFTPGTTTKPAGSGLGLFMSRRLAEQLGGTLELANRPSGGCRATLTLPEAQRAARPS